MIILYFIKFYAFVFTFSSLLLFIDILMNSLFSLLFLNSTQKIYTFNFTNIYVPILYYCYWSVVRFPIFYFWSKYKHYMLLDGSFNHYLFVIGVFHIFFVLIIFKVYGCTLGSLIVLSVLMITLFILILLWFVV